MEPPQGPRDVGLRVIIDKLAEFVSRNGPEFEKITKQKQQGNPKFDFLFGGEYAAYYQYRVAMEQNCLQQQEQQQQQQMPPHLVQQMQNAGGGHFTQAPPPQGRLHQAPPSLNAHDAGMFQLNQPPPSHRWGAQNQQQTPQASQQNSVAAVAAATAAALAPAVVQQANGANALTLNITAQIEAINMQQGVLREQIRQSEANLTAQHSALMKQQAQQIDEAIATAQNKLLDTQAEEHGIVLREFDSVLQPITESCTKDSISSGKNWILQHSADSAKNNIVLQYLLKKALVSGSTFQQKLHLIYLVNDILHHCVRKSVNDLKNSLENVVIPMFCSADLIATPEQRQKLSKLLSLWESKAKFFDACVISKLQSPDSSMQEYKTNLQNTHHEIVTQMQQATKNTLDNYNKQHQMFVQHTTQQITQLEQQKQQLEQQILAQVLPNTSILPPQQQQQNQQQPQQSANKGIPSLMSQKISMPLDDTPQAGGQQQQQTAGQSNNPFNPFNQPHPAQTTPQKKNPFATPPEEMGPNFFIPDMSKPPPGFPGQMNQAVNQQQQQQPAAAAAAAAAAALIQQQLVAQLQQQQNQNNIPTSNVSQGNNAAASSHVVNAVLNSANATQGQEHQQDNLNNLTIDMAALNAAIQLVKQQRHQQLPNDGGQQRRGGGGHDDNHSSHMNDSRYSNMHMQKGNMSLDNDIPPPAPSMNMSHHNSSAYFDDDERPPPPPSMNMSQHNSAAFYNDDERPPPPPSMNMSQHNAGGGYFEQHPHMQMKSNQLGGGDMHDRPPAGANAANNFDIPATALGVAALIMPLMHVSEFNKLPLQQQQLILQQQLLKVAASVNNQQQNDNVAPPPPTNNASYYDQMPGAGMMGMQQQQQHLGLGAQDDEQPPPPPSMLDSVRAANAYYDLPGGLMMQHQRGTPGEMSAAGQSMDGSQRPSTAYYDLPAGLMVPLINLNDYNYKPLDPAHICLPPPAPQSERLTNALAAFYSLPTHDRPRDNEGWEKLGLYEYYKVKNAARKEKEEKIKKGLLERSRSPSPIIIEQPKPKKINKRSYRSRSRSPSKTRSPLHSKSRSRSPRSRSPPARSPPPPRSRNADHDQPNSSSRSNSSTRNSSSNSRYGGRGQRSSPSRPSPQRDRERDRDSGSSNSRSGRGDYRESGRDSRDGRDNRSDRSTRRERERSITPPSFLGGNFAKPNEAIGQTNKGHQMLMKMGWTGLGTGLGTKNQGIDQPILPGEVRDRKDQFKGVGVTINDPFENFRKNKGAAFVHRMRARDEKS